MKRFDWVLFDADNTLFGFDSRRGLDMLFTQLGRPLCATDYEAYEQLNKSLWKQYEQGAITGQQLADARFAPWVDKLGVPSAELQRNFLRNMLDISEPLPGAVEVVRALQQETRLGIITNGFAELQGARLKKAGLQDAFEMVVVPEDVGFAKPHPRIFEHALALMGQPPRQRVLMVGDRLATDILGGANAGLQTCWLNPTGAPNNGVVPDYEMTHLQALRFIVSKSAAGPAKRTQRETRGELT